MPLPDRVERESHDRSRRGPAEAKQAWTAGRLEDVSELEHGDARDHPKQMAGRLQGSLRFQDDEIAPADPDFSSQQPKETFFTRPRVLPGLRLKREHVGALASDIFIRQALPILSVPQVVFPDGFDGGFRLVLFFLARFRPG